jgi:hypothetical protein
MKKDFVEYRVNRALLSDVCNDCAEHLKHSCVECEDCPVNRLKKRFNQRGHK